MTTFILLGLCASGAWCLHRYIKGSDERDRQQRAEVCALEQRAQFRVIPGGPRRTESWAVITRRDSAS